MDSRAKILGHPVHQMLVVVPLGGFTIAVAFDLVFLITGTAVFAVVAYWMIIAAIIGGLIAAPFGVIDWMAIPQNTRAKRVGVHHGVGNLIVLFLFFVSWMMRLHLEEPGALVYLPSFAGAALAVVTGWLGGELVDRLGIGVHEQANVDAPSSFPMGKRH